MRIDRMLAITIMLLNRERITARELSEKFEVSIRTIYRDIDAINMAGIPVVSYSGNTGGFGILDTYKLDRQLLTLNDMLAMLLALKGVNTVLEDKEFDSAIEKISSLIPRDKTEYVNLHLEQVVIDIMPWGHTQKLKDTLKIIHQAVIRNKLLSFDYRNSKGEANTRTVEPMTLIFKGYGWYLFAFCLLRNDYRLFRLSRMKNCSPLPREFNRRKMLYQNFMTSDDDNMKWVHLVLKFSSKVRYRVEDFFDEDQICIQENGDLIVNATFPEDEWIYSTIFSYGEYVEVLKPLYIRETVQKKIKKLLTIYLHNTTSSD